MVAKDRDFQSKLLSTFRVEAAEHVQALSSGLIELERALSEDERMKVVETVFREAHSLKGAARAVGQLEMESICQSLESVFSDLKRKTRDSTPSLFDALHDAVDALGRLLPPAQGEAAAGQKPPVSELLARLEAALHGDPERAAATPNAPSAEPVPSSHSPAEETHALADSVRVATAKLDAVLLRAEELLSAKLSASERAGEIREAAVTFGALKKELVKLAPGVKALQRARERTDRGGRDKSDLQLRTLLEFLAWEDAFVRSFEGRLAALASSAEQHRRSLGAMVDELLEEAKKVLMLPFSSVLAPFPKLVRDLSRDRRKEVELVTRGAEIEIDRRILEEIRDPLIHLVRNCVDHGIESREERRRASKPPRGTITIAVKQKSGGKIELLVSDDGAGVPLAKVAEAAQRLGIIPQDESRGRDEQALLSLVFRSGLSTSPIITDLSGRGLGLAIVREKVERLAGTVSVESRSGQGTAFRMVLPLSLATFRGVSVRVNAESFVLPAVYVEQALRLKKEAIRSAENRETISWNGQALALVRLADALELARAQPASEGSDFIRAVVLGSAGERVAFLVDEILEESEILLKPLGKQLARVRNVAGATVLGTGKAVPILDVPDLLRSASKAAATRVGAEAPRTEPLAERKSVLIAEDSITSRTLLKSILESAGYAVSTSVDGVDAFTLLKTERFDLVVSDVDMPRMNGLDLTAKIRADRALAELPVVLVTALESREDRERGIDVGANAYIVKSSFDQSNLLEAIRRLI